MTPGFAKTRQELPWLYYQEADRVIINAHNFGGGATDPDAVAYVSAVQAADGTTLSSTIVSAIDAFVIGCKSDGIWSAIKAAGFFAGPATLNGALIPLVGAAPTNNGFLSGDHSQATGILGDGTSYIDTNRNVNAEPQNNVHQSVWVVTASTVSLGGYIGAGGGVDAGSTHIVNSTGASNWVAFRNRSISFFATSPANITGFIGHSRADGANYTTRLAGTSLLRSNASNTSYNGNAYIFARNAGSPGFISNGRLAFWSIGEALDLSALDARLTTYMAAIA